MSGLWSIGFGVFLACGAPASAQTAAKGSTGAGEPELFLRYNTDVGYAPGGEDALPVGPDYLSVGLDGRAALHDPVRGEVVVLDRTEGVVGRFPMARVDGLALGKKGVVLVMDGQARTLTAYSDAGAVLKEIQVPGTRRDGTQTQLINGVVYAVEAGGERTPVALMQGGKPVPVGKEFEVDAAKLSASQGRVAYDGEPLAESLRVSAQLLGGRPPWIEVEAVSVAPGGAIRVERWAQQPGGERVALPVADAGYRPSFDLAVDPAGQLVFLAPTAEGVGVNWVVAP